MKEVVIKYKSNKALEALRDLGKYLGFSISDTPIYKADPQPSINGVAVIPGDQTVDFSELKNVLTGKGLNANELRKSGWQRR